MMKNNWNTLWLRWTLANGFAELFGLGATMIVIGGLTTKIDTQRVTGILLAFLIAVFSGAIEATIVGFAQWWAMHPWLPMIKRSAWWLGTLVGALLSYVLGYLPSTLMSLGETAEQAPQAEPAQWIVLLLAALLGAVAGAMLSFAQWMVLRGKVKRSGLWIPANMLAWAAGMPIIFWGMDLAFKMTAAWQMGLIIAGAILLSGLVVGAIHGRFLVLIAREQAGILPTV
jgi:magnesium-transporting ATPase (P-type)